MRRLAEREERRQKQQKKKGPVQRRRRRPREERVNFFVRIFQFLREVRRELEKVSWPSRDQMAVFTAVTLITSGAVTVIVFLMDVGMKEGILLLLRRT
jgi:preprotein translocase subunit SecE